MNKKTFKKISIILSSILVFLILAFCVIYFIILSPKKNFNRLINSIFDETINVTSRFSKDEFKSSINKGNIKLDTNIEKYNGLVGYEMEYDVENDKKNNKTLVNLKFGNDDENIEGTFYKDSDFLYFNFPFIMSDMIKIDLEKYGFNINSKSISYSKNDSKHVLNIIRTSVINNISNNKIKNSIEDYHIKSSYKIDNNELESLLNAIINDLNNDEESMKILLNDFNIDLEKLNSFKDSTLDNFNKKYEYLEINLYFSILLKLDNVSVFTKNYNIDLDIDDENQIVVKSDNKELLNTTFNNKMIKGNINKNSKSILFDLKLDPSKDEINIDGYISYDVRENEYIKLDLSLSTLLNEKISDYDTSLAKSFNQFTSKDLKSLYKIIDLVNKYIELLIGNNNFNIDLNI